MAVDGGLVWLVTIRDQPRHEVHCKIGGTAVPRVFHVHQVFELVKHRFHDRPPPQQQLLVQQYQAVRHVPFNVRDEAKLARAQACVRERLRQIAFVREQRAPNTFHQLWHGTTIIRIARG